MQLVQPLRQPLPRLRVHPEGIDHVRAGTMLIVLGCMLFEDTELTTAVLSCSEPRSNELMP